MIEELLLTVKICKKNIQQLISSAVNCGRLTWATETLGTFKALKGI